jgi:hypothetical protein
MNCKMDAAIIPVLQKLHKPRVRNDLGESAERLKNASEHSRALLDSLHQVRKVTDEMTNKVEQGHRRGDKPLALSAEFAMTSLDITQMSEEEEDAMIVALKRSGVCVCVCVTILIRTRTQRQIRTRSRARTHTHTHTHTHLPLLSVRSGHITSFCCPHQACLKLRKRRW